MLRIRPEQMKALEVPALSCFRTDMRHHLRDRFPRETGGMTDGDLSDLVSDGCARAETYGIRHREDVRRFLECMVVHGRAFPEDREWASRILSRRDVSGTARMDRIADYEVFSLRKAR